MDPNDDTQQQPAADTSSPADDQAITQQPEDNAQPEQVDAFSAGVEEARAAEAAESAPAAQPDPAADAEVVKEGGEPPADPASQSDPQQPAAVDPPKDEPGQQPPSAKTVDEEIKDLGITNERTQQRFRELSQRAADADQLREQAARADEWEKAVTSTGANPQQFGNALNYLAAINSGNPDAMAQAYEAMEKELQWLAQKIGREAPGFDPLSEYPDLAEKVATGDLTREVAAELVQTRKRGALQHEHQTAQQQAYQAQVAEQQGMQSVVALGAQLRASDPQFQQKFAFIQPMIEIIQQSIPPAKWAEAIHSAYQRLPAVPAAAPATPAVPARPNNPARASAAPAVAAVPKKPEDAFAFGVAEAQAMGR